MCAPAKDLQPEASGSSLKVKYVVQCAHCGNPFDAMEQPWCNCLTSQRTLVCPHCLQCFCKSPRTFKDGFWSNAPQELWQKKLSRSMEAFVPKAPPDPEAVRRPLVLVVEDEKEIQKVAVLAVESLGYSLLLAKNGAEGLEMAERYKPDLVLSDALMPKLDGREMCLRIKGNPDLAGTRVVVMTSVYKTAKYDLEARKKYRADRFITKPVDFGQLREILQEYLG